MKLTREDGDFRAIIVAAFIASLCNFIPYAGGIISFVVLIVLISKWTTAKLWPSAVLLVIVANGIGFLLGIALIAMVMGGK